MAGALVGTPVYMAPEQTDGTPGDAQSEVWSLGIVLYELLCGRRPFERASIPEVLQAIRTQHIVPPSLAAPERAIPQRLDAVVMRGAGARSHAALRRHARVRSGAASGAAANRRSAQRRRGGDARRRRARSPSARRRWRCSPPSAATPCSARAPPPPPPPSKPEPPSVTVTSTRRITFEAGCEEYPSFTPDGRTVVFDGVMENDYELGALDLVVGHERRLTHEPGWDYGGAVSPDGQMDRLRAHVRLGARDARLADRRRSRQQAAAARAERVRLSVVDARRRRARRRERSDLALDASIHAACASRRSRGCRRARSIATSRSSPTATSWRCGSRSTRPTSWSSARSPRGGSARAVETLPLDSIGLVVAPSQGGYFYGRHHANANELVRRRFGGAAAETVAGDVTPASGLSISPDGKRLAYSTCRESGVMARLRPGKPPEPLMAAGNWRDIWPAPVDDRRVLFQSDRAGAVQVWLLDLKAHEARPIGAPSSSNPAVSPDGAWVAYGGGAEPGIHVVPLDRRRRDARDRRSRRRRAAVQLRRQDHRLRVDARARRGARLRGARRRAARCARCRRSGALSPAASPTEDRVVFVLPTDKGRVLMSTTLDGRAPLPLVAALPAGDWLNPRFSRDGKKLVVVRKTAEVVELELGDGHVACRLQGGARRHRRGDLRARRRRAGSRRCSCGAAICGSPRAHSGSSAGGRRSRFRGTGRLRRARSLRSLRAARPGPRLVVGIAASRRSTPRRPRKRLRRPPATQDGKMGAV